MNDEWLHHRAQVMARTALERWASDWNKNEELLYEMFAYAIAEGANAQFAILQRLKAEEAEKTQH